MKLRVVIAEDQPDARAWLVQLAARIPDVSVVADVGNGVDAREAIERLRPNLVLLDVQMPLLDGFGVVEAIGPAMPATIFVTAHDTYAIRAFELHAIDYLLKPFGPARLSSAIERARKHLERDKAGVLAARLMRLVDQMRDRPGSSRLAIRNRERTLFIDHDRIDWLEANAEGVLIHAGAESYDTREPLEDVLGRLPEDEFVRIHKSHAINVARVAELKLSGGGQYEVQLTTGVRLRLSRQRRVLLEQKLGLPSTAAGSASLDDLE